MRQRAFDFGLFKKYLLSIVTAQLQQEGEILFEGLIDVPGPMCEPLRSVPLVLYVRPSTFHEVSLEHLVKSIAEHFSKTADFDPETAVPADLLDKFQATRCIADVFQWVFCSTDPFTKEEDAQGC